MIYLDPLNLSTLQIEILFRLIFLNLTEEANFIYIQDKSYSNSKFILRLSNRGTTSHLKSNFLHEGTSTFAKHLNQTFLPNRFRTFRTLSDWHQSDQTLTGDDEATLSLKPGGWPPHCPAWSRLTRPAAAGARSRRTTARSSSTTTRSPTSTCLRADARAKYPPLFNYLIIDYIIILIAIYVGWW